MLQNKSISEQSQIQGIPALQEVEIVYYGPKNSELIQIKSSSDIHNVLRNQVFDSRKINYKESFHVILLNRANKIIGHSCVGVGNTNATVTNPKEIFQLALKSNASSIILSHNHPSGNLEPSEADLKLTKKIKYACECMEIQLIDHIIITSESYYSFADEGVL